MMISFALRTQFKRTQCAKVLNAYYNYKKPTIMSNNAQNLHTENLDIITIFYVPDPGIGHRHFTYIISSILTKTPYAKCYKCHFTEETRVQRSQNQQVREPRFKSRWSRLSSFANCATLNPMSN